MVKLEMYYDGESFIEAFITAQGITDMNTSIVFARTIDDESTAIETANNLSEQLGQSIARVIMDANELYSVG